MPRSFSPLGVCLSLILVSNVFAADADKAQAILHARCGSCHGSAANAKGGFGYVLDRERLVTRDKIVPGKASESALFQRVKDGEMPPGKAKLTADEMAVLERWIDGGAPRFDAGPPATTLTQAGVARAVLADLQN